MKNTREASVITGLSYRQVDYLINQGILSPAAEFGQGKARQFSFQDLVMLQLAAILRAANALAKEPFQTIRDLKVTREGDQMIITAQNVSDLALERSALASRGDLFTEVFGRNIILREALKSS